jgi:hypothetical protein
MNPTTLTALKASIEHWKRMRDSDTQYEKPYSTYCALCSLFIDKDCRGCPVREATHTNRCQDSPYNAAEIAWHRYYMPEEYEREDQEGALKTWREAAQKEIDFLESLIPIEEQLRDSIVLEQAKKDQAVLP